MGEARNLRHLVWVCVNHLADHVSDRAVVVVTETFDQPTTAAEKARHARIAKQCGIEVTYYRILSTHRSVEQGTGDDA